MRLIDADELIKSIPTTSVDLFENCRNCSLLDDWRVKELVEDAPTIDAVEVVRCKDCKYRYVDGENVRFNVCELNHNKAQPDDWYCGDAERRSDD